VRDVPVVFLTAGRLFLRHWPALVTLGLLGGAMRNGAVWTAIQLSDVHGQLGQLMLVLAPLGFLLPVVAMLSVCRRSLPALQRVEALDDVAPTEGRQLRLLDVAVSVMVPFLAVYSSYGLLEQDIFRYRNVKAAELFMQNLESNHEVINTAARLGVYSVQVAVLVVLGAWLVRYLLGRAERRFHLTALAYVGAFVEVYYTTQLASQLVVLKVRGVPWLEDRVAAQWLEDAYDSIVDVLGPLSSAFAWLVHGAQDLAGSFTLVVVVPVGWLALAAVVLGYRLAVQETAAEVDPDEQIGFVRAFWLDVKERFSSLFSGVRLLAAAGLAPMLVFCLVFLLVTRIPFGLHLVMRELVGPRFFGTWVAINPYEAAFGFALSLMVTAPMLAGAIDWLVRTQTAARSSEFATTPAPV
jgi:hypothetical protein